MTTHSAATTPLPFELAEPQSFGALTLFPLLAAAPPRLEYVGLDEAAAHGLTVTEAVERGVVEQLLVTNPLDLRVLLYEGEELVGAKQNRILARSILVDTHSKTAVPVKCVERGRWAYRSAAFEPAPRAAYPELRRVRHAGGGQAEVWASVAQKAARLDVLAPTEAVEDVYVSRAPHLDEYVRALPRVPGQCGSLVAIAGRVTCLDYVSRSDVWAGLHAKLLRGFALDAVEAPFDKPPLSADLERLLDGIARAERRAEPGVGVGEERRVRGPDAVGAELVADGEVVALSAFAA